MHMNHLADYLSKQPDFYSRISPKPSKNTGFIVVVPCYDEPDVLSCLDSLKQCKPPEKSIEVIVVINASEDTPANILEANSKSFAEVETWALKNSRSNFSIHCVMEEKLPARYAGPGLARKIGMDEACSRFHQIKQEKASQTLAGQARQTLAGQGIICSMDADSLCDENYFTELEKLMKAKPETGAGSIYFEHPLKGKDYPPEVYEAVSLYELNMRYFYQALRSTGFPYAQHSLGSAFFVTANAYARAGGMNRRIAGEDFYFLQKLIPNSHFQYLNTTRVIPSPRPSDRVLFGTGPWIRRFVRGELKTYLTYDFQAFLDLKFFIAQIPIWYSKDYRVEKEWYEALPDPLKNFFGERELLNKLEEIRMNTSGTDSFMKRFFSWFNGLRIIRFLNHSHSEAYSKSDVVVLSTSLLETIFGIQDPPKSAMELLKVYRELERRG